MAFSWTSDLETGNVQIDGEHKTLIQAVNDLLSACSQGKGRQELVSTVDFLVDYTKTHFNHEEKLQAQYKYPQYATHKAWHDSFISQVAELAAQLKSEGPTLVVMGEVNAKVGLLITHIKTEDSKLAKHIKTQ